MKNLVTAILMTVVTTVLLGLIYPLVVTGIAQVIFRVKANGQLIERDGQVIGSRIIGQPFSSPGYFRPRPSAAGANGYDAAGSAGTNYGPTNKTGRASCREREQISVGGVTLQHKDERDHQRI